MPCRGPFRSLPAWHCSVWAWSAWLATAGAAGGRRPNPISRLPPQGPPSGGPALRAAPVRALAAPVEPSGAVRTMPPNQVTTPAPTKPPCQPAYEGAPPLKEKRTPRAQEEWPDRKPRPYDREEHERERGCAQLSSRV